MNTPGFFTSAMGPFRGLSFLRQHPRLIRFLLLPWGLLICLTALLFFLSFSFFSDLQGWLFGDMSGFLRSTLSFFLGLLLVLLSLLLAFLLSQLLSAPIFTRMAAETRSIYTGIPARPAEGIYADVVLPVLSQAQKITLFLLPQIPLLFLNFVPVVGSIVYVLLSTLFTLFWIALDYFDYPLDTESDPLNVGDRVRYIFRHLPMTSGFSTTMLLILYIPIVNLIILPVGVIGATLLHCDVVKSETSPDTSP